MESRGSKGFTRLVWTTIVAYHLGVQLSTPPTATLSLAATCLSHSSDSGPLWRQQLIPYWHLQFQVLLALPR